MEKDSSKIFRVETFEEMPNGYLVINNNSNYFLILCQNESYIALQNIDLITIIRINGIDRILCRKSYYNVENGKIILSEKCIYDLDKNFMIYSNKDSNIKIINLNSYLKLQKDDVKYLCLEEVKEITESNDENYCKKIQR